VEDVNISDGNALTDEVEINFNMLHALMLNEVGGEVDRTNIVTVTDRAHCRLAGVVDPLGP
jgi:hypothetical protein